jgi:hypothetical protein
VDTGFRKRSCSNNKVERDGDSKKSHLSLEHFPEKWTPVFRKKMRSSMRILDRFPVQPNRKAV